MGAEREGNSVSSAGTARETSESVGIRTEVEDYFFYRLSRTRSIPPLLQRLGGEVGEHGVATLDFDIGDIAVGQHAGFSDNPPLEVAFPEEFRIFRLHAQNDLTPTLRSPLGSCGCRMKRQQNQCACKGCEKLAGRTRVAQCDNLKIHRA